MDFVPRAEGKRHREKVGRRASAIDAVARRRLEVKRDSPFHRAPEHGSLFRDLATAALAQKKLLLASLSYETDLGRLTELYPLIGKVPADCLTPARIAETLGHLKASMTGSTVNRYRSVISSVYSFAIRAGKMTTNPVARVKRFRENDSRLNWLKPDEEKAIREAIDTNRHEAEFSLVLHTGIARRKLESHVARHRSRTRKTHGSREDRAAPHRGECQRDRGPPAIAENLRGRRVRLPG